MTAAKIAPTTVGIQTEQPLQQLVFKLCQIGLNRQMFEFAIDPDDVLFR